MRGKAARDIPRFARCDILPLRRNMYDIRQNTEGISYPKDISYDEVIYHSSARTNIIAKDLVFRRGLLLVTRTRIARYGAPAPTARTRAPKQSTGLFLSLRSRPVRFSSLKSKTVGYPQGVSYRFW